MGPHRAGGDVVCLSYLAEIVVVIGHDGPHVGVEDIRYDTCIAGAGEQSSLMTACSKLISVRINISPRFPIYNLSASHSHDEFLC